MKRRQVQRQQQTPRTAGQPPGDARPVPSLSNGAVALNTACPGGPRNSTSCAFGCLSAARIITLEATGGKKSPSLFKRKSRRIQRSHSVCPGDQPQSGSARTRTERGDTKAPPVWATPGAMGGQEGAAFQRLASPQPQWPWDTPRAPSQASVSPQEGLGSDDRSSPAPGFCSRALEWDKADPASIMMLTPCDLGQVA